MLPIRFLAVIVTLGSALSAHSAIAASPKDLQECDQPAGANPNRVIAVCTRALVGADAKSASHFFNSRGIAWDDKEQYDRAIADLSEAIRVDPDYARPYVSRGLAWKHKGDVERAIGDFDTAIRLDPQFASGYIDRGNLQNDKGQHDRAIADFNEAIRCDPKSVNAYNGRGIAWYGKGEFDRAIADFNEAIRLDPQEANTFNSRGDAWSREGEYDRAIADLSEAIRLAPRWGIPRANRGRSWRLKGDLVRALADQNIAINGIRGTIADPNKGSFVFVERGDTLRYMGEFARAIADYQHALRNEPGYIPSLTGLGLTFEKMSDLAKARAWFEQAAASENSNRFNTVSKSALETARARLAALNSGIAQPSIPNALPKATSVTSIPTPTVPAPSVPSTVLKAAAGKQGLRIALVIGNSEYRNVPVLANPRKDAEAIATSLRNIGFDRVTLANDATREKLIDSLRAFANEAEEADWAMVYYAGHGMEVGGVNYLVPTDAKLAVDRDIQFEAVPLDQVLAAVDAARKLKLVVLDACRDNPFSPRRSAGPDAAASPVPTGGARIASRSIGRGLAEVNVTGGTLVVFAAKNGQVALDGDGDNSPFAVAMLQRIASPGVEINKLFRLVRDDVMEATAGRQEPYTYGSLPGREDFFFVEK